MGALSEKLNPRAARSFLRRAGAAHGAAERGARAGGKSFCGNACAGTAVADGCSTSKASREFPYVEDAARTIRLASERYDGPDPVNLSTGFEITIRDLVELVAKLMGFAGEIHWDDSKPDGQPRRYLDTTRARRLFGFRAATGFEEGLRRTIEWYKQQRAGSSTP